MTRDPYRIAGPAGAQVRRAYVDKGYRGHDVTDHPARVYRPG